MKDLKKIQNFIEVKPVEKEVEADIPQDDMSKDYDVLKGKYEANKKELEEKKQECSHLREVAVKTTKENENLRAEYDEWKGKTKLILMIGGGILGLSLLANFIKFFF